MCQAFEILAVPDQRLPDRHLVRRGDIPKRLDKFTGIHLEGLFELIQHLHHFSGGGDKQAGHAQHGFPHDRELWLKAGFLEEQGHQLALSQGGRVGHVPGLPRAPLPHVPYPGDALRAGLWPSRRAAYPCEW